MQEQSPSMVKITGYWMLIWFFFFHFFLMKCHHLINSEHGSRTNSRLENVRHYLSTLDRSPWFNSMHVHSPLENLSLHQSEWDAPQQNISPVINLNGGHPTICIPPFLPCTHNQCHRSHVFYIDLNGAWDFARRWVIPKSFDPHISMNWRGPRVGPTRPCTNSLDEHVRTWYVLYHHHHQRIVQLC